VPLTVFDTKGIPAARRERIEAAVVAGGKHRVGAGACSRRGSRRGSFSAGI